VGTLSVPASGVVYLDTAPIIYTIERHADYEALLLPLWAALDGHQIDEILTSELTLLETLVKPLRDGDHALAADYEKLLTATGVRTQPITASLLRDAAHIRAAVGGIVVMDFQKLISSPSEAYQEGLRFFMGEGVLNQTIQRVRRDLEHAGIDYSVIGALALNQHGYKRFTEDIDLLMTSEGLQKFQELLVGLGYRPSFEGASRKFRTTQENVTVEIITTGEYPGDGQPKPVRFHDPKDDFVVIDGIKTVTLEKLLELKLASGMTAPHRLKDLADVQELIKVKNLDVDFAGKLNPYVREKFLELQRAVALAQEQEQGRVR